MPARHAWRRVTRLWTSPVRDLLADIERRLGDPDALNLSLAHKPMIISQATGTIISTLHFRRQDDDVLKREAFRQAVSYIDVETSSQCNRRCGYCPNATNDRLSSNSFMDDAVFVPFVNNLRAIDYARDVHFVGFNEPLMHKENLLGRLALTRRLLPRAAITVYTNGDYLTPEYLEHLIAAGMSDMIISVHLAPDKPYHEGEIFDRINRVAQRLGTPITPLSYMKDTYITAQLIHPGAKIIIRQLDYMRWGSNRASVLGDIGPQIAARQSACVLPINQFILRYDGYVDPCCTIFSDTPSTRHYSVGNVGDASSIFDIYCGEKAGRLAAQPVPHRPQAIALRQMRG